MVKLEMEKSGEPISLSEAPTQLGVSVPMGGEPPFAAFWFNVSFGKTHLFDHARKSSPTVNFFP